MRHSMPCTPFATRLSGSAKETELRLRSIFQWKKKRPPAGLVILIAAVVLLCFGLVSCEPKENEPGGYSAAETTQEPSDETENRSPEGTKEAASPGSNENFDTTEFFASYVTEFPFYIYSGMKVSDHDGRVFTIEDTPKNLAEAAVITCYGLNWTGGTKKLELYCGNESLVFEPESNYKKYTIHEVSTLAKEEFTEESMPYLSSFLRDLTGDVQKYGLSEYTVVYLNKSWEWTDAAKARGPQLGDGRYEWLYLLGKTEQAPGWKLYNVYWGEYVYGRTLEPIAPTAAQEVLAYVDQAFSNDNVHYFCWLFPGTGPAGVDVTDCYQQVRQVFEQYNWTREDWDLAKPEKGSGDWDLQLESDYGPLMIASTNSNLFTVYSEQACYSYDGEPGELVEKLIGLWDGPSIRHAMFCWPDQINSDQELADTYVEWFREFYLNSGAVEEIRWQETTIESSDEAYLRILVRYSVKPADLSNIAWRRYPVTEDGWVDVALSIALEKNAPHQVSWYQTP